MAIQYHIYGSDGASGPINYGTPIATVAGLTYSPAALGLSSDNSFAVRAFDTVSGLEETNVDAVVRIVVDGSGNDATAIPLAPAMLAATPKASGTIRVHWTWPGRGPRPTGWHVYQGIGTVSYASPVASIAYNGIGPYFADIASLTDGTTYVFGVRSYNASGIDQNVSIASATAVVTPPANVESLTATPTSQA